MNLRNGLFGKKLDKISFENAISDAIKGMALVNDKDKRKKLRLEARKHDLSGWRKKTIMKVAAVGGVTGVAGGPLGLLLEPFDIAYLLAASGRGCYGVGHILRRKIDYEADIPMILAIWAGAAKASATVGVGKIAIKIVGKKALAAGAPIVGKALTKAVFKGGAKVAQKVISMAVTKIVGKASAKLSVKWIPIAGGAIGAGISWWVAGGLLEAAEKYYSNNFVVFNDDVANDLIESVDLIG